MRAAALLHRTARAIEQCGLTESGQIRCARHVNAPLHGTSSLRLRRVRTVGLVPLAASIARSLSALSVKPPCDRGGVRGDHVERRKLNGRRWHAWA